MYLLHPDPAHAEAVAKSIGRISDLASGLLRNSDAADDAEAVARTLDTYRSDFDDYTELVVAQAGQAEAMAETAERLDTVFSGVRDAGAAEMRAGIDRAETAIYLAAAVALGLGLCFAFFNTRGIVRPIGRAMETLRRSSGRLAGASEQMDDASRSLADSTSEQAATVEETAASMEEIAAMMETGRNSTEQIERLMTGTLERVREADDILRRLTSAMDDILGASREISKVHKSIDELAFQTNLLSLNAAIEAARVGEYGSGFAVVAEEVRNLAARSADSAKSASEMIEATTGKIDTGKALVDSANGVFSEVRRAMEETGGVMGELASAAGEQTRAVDQVNRATSEMDRTIQKNAASAEETAAALTEMSRQSGDLEKVVLDLNGLIHGRRASAAGPDEIPP
jgi:methyl-accepting chemotaxis protein